MDCMVIPKHGITLQRKSIKDCDLLLEQLFPYMPYLNNKDEHGNSYRGKYRTVVLGNLDAHNWSKTHFFAPVMP